MTDSEIRKSLGKLLGIDIVYYGADINQETQVQIKNLWWSTISYFHLGGELLVAVINTNQGKKGVLIVPYGSSDNAQSPRTALLDLPQWNDPVAQALHDMDLFPDEERNLKSHYSFDLYVEAHYSSSTLKFAGSTKNPKQGRLWSALVKIVFDLAELSNDETIIKFIDKTGRYSDYKSPW